jgi:hypothetical protein
MSLQGPYKLLHVLALLSGNCIFAVWPWVPVWIWNAGLDWLSVVATCLTNIDVINSLGCWSLPLRNRSWWMLPFTVGIVLVFKKWNHEVGTRHPCPLQATPRVFDNSTPWQVSSEQANMQLPVTHPTGCNLLFTSRKNQCKQKFRYIMKS